MNSLLLVLLAQDQPSFRSDVALVHVDAEVRQGNRLIDDLKKESFRVIDGGKLQSIVYFGHQEEPLDVILLFDTRGKMRTVVAGVAEAAHTALSEIRPGDRVGVMAFGVTAGSCRTDLIADLTSDFDSAELTISSQVLQLEFAPGTFGCSVHSGLVAAAQSLRKLPTGNRRRAIVIVTDDKGAPTRLDVVRDTIHDLWDADAVVLCVMVNSGANVVWIGPPYRGARYAAEKTGGDTLATQDAGEGLREMIHRLRSRYSLYYALPKGAPGAEKKIKVQLTPEAAKSYPGADVRARTGYLVPGTSR